MLQIQGLVINPGLKTGTAKHLRPTEHRIETKSIGQADIANEIKLFEDAIDKVEAEILSFLDKAELGDKDKEILRIHQDILRDPEIYKSITHSIERDLLSAAQAVSRDFEKFIQTFQQIEDEFYRARALDYKDIASRLLGQILGEDSDVPLPDAENQIFILKEITPSQVTRLAKSGATAYCCEHGSFNSHSSILSRALNLLALGNLDRLVESVQDGDLLILDGISGTLYVHPDRDLTMQYKQLEDKYIDDTKELGAIRHLECITKGGRAIQLSANLGLPHELEKILELGCDGIGLFRTEFLYLSKNRLPDEEQQTEIYGQILSKLSPAEVTIRTFDLGGDKLSHLLPYAREENPYLGCRGLRFSLCEEELFRTQLRAILRASVYGRAKIMFPMVMDVEDFLKARAIVQQCKKELEAEGLPFKPDIPLGVMIEIPSAALCADALAKEADFFSIGTNDLVQYTLAVDRNNDSIARMYIQHHPAVLKLIKMIIEAGEKQQIPVSVCGEMASVEEYVPLLIGMGIKQLSVNPGRYIQCKRIIRNCDPELDELLKNWDAGASLSAAEHMIYERLKPYYTR